MNQKDLLEGLEEQIRRDFRIELFSKDFQQEEVPGVVYHYASPEAFAGIIEGEAVRFSNAAYLNDPSELTYAVALAHLLVNPSFSPRAARISGLKLPINEQEMEEQTFLVAVDDQIMAHASFKTWYTASFSFEGNDLSQWRAYCGAGGYSIGFDRQELVSAANQSANQEWPVIHGPVEYEPEKQQKRLSQILDRYRTMTSIISNKYADLPRTKVIERYAMHAGIVFSCDMLFLKKPAFKSEREWRMGINDYPFQNSRFRFRLGKSGVLVPYLDLPISINGKLPIKEVWVSPVGDQDLAAHSARLLLDARGYNGQELVRQADFRLRP